MRLYLHVPVRDATEKLAAIRLVRLGSRFGEKPEYKILNLSTRYSNLQKTVYQIDVAMILHNMIEKFRSEA